MSVTNVTNQEARARALDLIRIGMNDTEIAKEVGVARMTIWRWKSEPEFVAVCNEMNRDAQQRAREGVKALVMKAIQTLDDALDDEDSRVRMSAAKLVLERVDPVGTASEQARELLQAYLVSIVAHLAADTKAETFAETRDSLGRFVQQGGPTKVLPRGIAVKVETMEEKA